jgi:proteasome accessory factor A
MARQADRLVKLCGADVELANFIVGLDRPGGTAREASRALLHEIDAPFARRDERFGGARASDPQDWGRKYLASNSACIYIDLDHLEVAQPETRSAWDHVAAWHAMLRIVRAAQSAANARLPAGQHLHVLANNSDGLGHTYGSHLNFLVTRRLYDNVFEYRLQYMLVLAAFQASSIVMTGQGKVGAENGRPDVRYQLSQRADHAEVICGAQTTYRRPIVNSRDEALCGPGNGLAAGLARLHVIFFDSVLCHGSALLRVGPMQLLLSMFEAERVNPDLMLEDPVTAAVIWSHDPSLRARVRMASGARLTAVELQLRFLEEAQRFAATGGFDGWVPRANEILAFWEDTLVRLRDGDVPGLASRLDWALKLHVIERAMATRPGLDWSDPIVKHLDLLYASVDPTDGLYWAYDEVGAVERLVSEDEIARLVDSPPEDTRAWGRAMLLRLGGARVHEVDWDRVVFREHRHGAWPRLRTITLGDPLGFTRAAVAPVIAAADRLDDVLDALGSDAPCIDGTPSFGAWLPPASPADGAAAPERRSDDEHP